MRKLLSILPFLILVSCDCYFESTGVVLDEITCQPIEEVSLSKTREIKSSSSTYDKVLTDQNGLFEFDEISRICDDRVMYFIKEGYELKEFTLRQSASDTVYLTPISRN